MSSSQNIVHEKSCGVVVYHGKGEKREFLLLHYPEGHWDLPKGHVEEGESEIETALRELEEETGLKEVRIIEGFHEKIHYFFRKKNALVSKSVYFFIVETKRKEITLSFEHQGFTWLPFDEALEKCTFKNVKEILLKSHDFLSGLDN